MNNIEVVREVTEQLVNENIKQCRREYNFYQHTLRLST